jgi:chaperonin GroES
MSANNKPISFQPLGDWLLIEPIPKSLTPGGIALPETAEIGPPLAKVIRVGPGAITSTGTLIPPDVAEGDVVYLYLAQKPTAIELNGRRFALCRNRDLVGKLETAKGTQ